MTNKWLRIGLRVLLLVSLALNAAVFAFLLSLGNMRDTTGFKNAGLPRDVRQIILEAARTDPDLLTELRALGDARRAVVAAGLEQPFDRDKVAAAMEEVRQGTTRVQIVAQRIILDAFEARASRESEG